MSRRPHSNLPSSLKFDPNSDFIVYSMIFRFIIHMQPILLHVHIKIIITGILALFNFVLMLQFYYLIKSIIFPDLFNDERCSG